MWVKSFVYYISFVISIFEVYGHLPMHVSTPPNKIEQFCVLADTCIHDTIPICGRMGDEKRTFMDLCDLLEYACDTNQTDTLHPLIPYFEYLQLPLSLRAIVENSHLQSAMLQHFVDVSLLIGYFMFNFIPHFMYVIIVEDFGVFTHVDDMEGCPLIRPPH